jgi:hypothetical protein
MADETVVENARRPKKDKCIRTYLDAEGNELGSRAKNEAAAVRLEVAEASWDRTLSFADMPEAVRAAAALYGAVNSITNTIGKAGMSSQDMVDALEGRIEAIFDNGIWAEGAQGGPRTNDVLEAVCRWYAGKKGDVTDEWKATMKGKLAEDKAFNENLRGRPEIAVLIETIRMERQAERLKKATEKAQAGAPAEGGSLEDLLG